MNGVPERSERFRLAIAAFIHGRRDAKLKGKDDDAATALKYEYTAWLTDAARRVGQIQAVTHVLKATHPDARGSSLHVLPADLPAHSEIGSHLLGDDLAEDVVGNAAALDVFKLLKLEVEGRRLLDWAQAGDDDLRQALHADPHVANDWLVAFGNLVRRDLQPASHALAKQIYWLVGEEPVEDDQYHLLQPLASSSLAHAVHTSISDARFGEDNKIARQAFREKAPFDGIYRDFRGLVARKLGGTKPQNISQLNSERGGVNYLMASLPQPRWERQPRPLLKVDSAWDRFGSYDGVRQQLRVLIRWMATHADDKPTMPLRVERERIEQDLAALLGAFGLDQQQRFGPGWTRDPDCQLPLCEKLWLDPLRTELQPRPDHIGEDEAFSAAYTLGDWPDEVAGRFAHWVNAALRDAGLTKVGDVEIEHWARQTIIDVAWPIPLQRRAGGPA